MKTRKFKNTGLQAMYNLYRNSRPGPMFNGTAAQGAYKAGLNGFRNPGVPTSLAHAAWAAGADERHDLLKEAGLRARDTSFEAIS